MTETDITDGLAQLGGKPASAAPEDTVAADLARAHTALRNRRLRLGGALSVAALIIGGAGYLTASGPSAAGSRHHTTASAPLKIHQGGPGPAQAKIRLTAYTGHQPQGFNVASVPQGFHLQTQMSSAFAFVLAPPGADKQPYSFAGKLVVTAEAGSELGHWKTFGDRSVTVHGGRARIGDQGGATQLWFGVSHGVVVDVQAWDSIGLTQQQMISFADGVTTTSALQLSHG